MQLYNCLPVHTDLDNVTNYLSNININSDALCKACKSSNNYYPQKNKIRRIQWVRSKKLINLIKSNKYLGDYDPLKDEIIHEALCRGRSYFYNKKYKDISKRDLGKLFTYALREGIPIYSFSELDQNGNYNPKHLFLDEVLNYLWGPPINVNKEVFYKMDGYKWCQNHTCPKCFVNCKKSSNDYCLRCISSFKNNKNNNKKNEMEID